MNARMKNTESEEWGEYQENKHPVDAVHKFLEGRGEWAPPNPVLVVPEVREIAGWAGTVSKRMIGGFRTGVARCTESQTKGRANAWLVQENEKRLWPSFVPTYQIGT